MSTLTALILCAITGASCYALGHHNGVQSGTKDAIRRLNTVLRANKLDRL